MTVSFSRPVFRRLLRAAGLCAALCAAARARAQVPANLLPVLNPAGEYLRSSGAAVKVVSVSQGGVVLECAQPSADGSAPCVWREHYSVRNGELVLDSVLTQQMVPPQPAHLEWQAAAAMGTSNIGPADLNPRWKNHSDYLQGLMEIIQREWVRQVAEDHSQPLSGSIITIRFLLNSRGEVVRLLGVHDSDGVPPAASVPCIRAINKRAPYGTWSDDMVAELGDQQEVTLSFHYQ